MNHSILLKQQIIHQIIAIENSRVVLRVESSLKMFFTNKTLVFFQLRITSKVFQVLFVKLFYQTEYLR